MVKGDGCIQGCPAALVEFYKEENIDMDVKWNGENIVVLKYVQRGHYFGFFRGKTNCQIAARMTSGR